MMKVMTRMLTLAIVGSAVLFFSNCGSDDKEAVPQDVQLGKLKKTWTIATTNGATLGTTDRTSDFGGFTLTFSGTFNSNNPDGPYDFNVGGTRPNPSPWPASGKWTFSAISGDSGTIIRTTTAGGDPTPVSYSIASNGQLTITFECSGCDYQGSRAKAVDGIWTFVLN